MRNKAPLLGGLLRKLLLDVMPTAFASAIGGFLLTHYGFNRAAEPVAAQVAPASPEMMQVLRDEHGLIVSYLKAHVANEKKQLAAADAEPRVAAVEPQPAAVSPAPPARPTAVTVALAKPPLPRTKVPVVDTAQAAPLAIAPPLPTSPAEAANAAPANSNSLLAKTIGIKDHVVAATQSVVSAIGGIPSWFGAIGDRIGGDEPNPRPRADVVDAS
jgi:hypothetical protein